jgi:hypothetical protein
VPSKDDADAARAAAVTLCAVTATVLYLAVTGADLPYRFARVELDFVSANARDVVSARTRGRRENATAEPPTPEAVAQYVAARDRWTLGAIAYDLSPHPAVEPDEYGPGAPACLQVVRSMSGARRTAIACLSADDIVHAPPDAEVEVDIAELASRFGVTARGAHNSTRFESLASALRDPTTQLPEIPFAVDPEIALWLGMLVGLAAAIELRRRLRRLAAARAFDVGSPWLVQRAESPLETIVVVGWCVLMAAAPSLLLAAPIYACASFVYAGLWPTGGWLDAGRALGWLAAAAVAWRASRGIVLALAASWAPAAPPESAAPTAAAPKLRARPRRLARTGLGAAATRQSRPAEVVVVRSRGGRGGIASPIAIRRR